MPLASQCFGQFEVRPVRRLAENAPQGLGHLGDDLGLLLAGDAVACDANIDVWHVCHLAGQLLPALAPPSTGSTMPFVKSAPAR
jgi:hypothetical protein